MTWTPTIVEVTNQTLVTVEGATIVAAQNIIEDELGRTEAAASANMTARETRIVNRAIAYQAAYLHQNPGVLSGLDLASFSQPDYAATFKGGASAGSHILSPMAKRTLRHLPRVGSRSVATESWMTDPNRSGNDDDGDASDREWTPIA